MCVSSCVCELLLLRRIRVQVTTRKSVYSHLGVVKHWLVNVGLLLLMVMESVAGDGIVIVNLFCGCGIEGIWRDHNLFVTAIGWVSEATDITTVSGLHVSFITAKKSSI